MVPGGYRASSCPLPAETVGGVLHLDLEALPADDGSDGLERRRQYRTGP